MLASDFVNDMRNDSDFPDRASIAGAITIAKSKPGRGASLMTKFLQRIVIHESDCWLWVGSLNNEGYGNFVFEYLPNGRARVQRGAHRVSYELFVGPIPAGLHLDHLCRVTGCVNPAHLEPVTVAENVRRGNSRFSPAKRALKQTHCKHGHEFTAENTGVQRATGSRYCRTCRSISGKLRKGRPVPDKPVPPKRYIGFRAVRYKGAPK